MDWNNLNADKNKWLNKHYTSGRSAKLDRIVIHHNAGNLTTEGCYSVWQSREASAHYQVEADGTIGQLVHDWDTAWHCPGQNSRSIGIEHANNQFGPWTVSDATLEAGAHLVAALCKYYGFGRPTWGVNVFGHNDFNSTACPGQLGTGGSQNAKYMQRAQAWYDSMTGTKSSSGGSSGGSSSSSSSGAGLTVDGYWGKATTTALQKHFGLTVDGIVSHQLTAERSKVNNCCSSFEWDSTRIGSPTIKAIQGKVGVEQDGLIGTNTINAMIKYYQSVSGAAYCDGRLDAGSITIKAMQKALNSGKF